MDPGAATRRRPGLRAIPQPRRHSAAVRPVARPPLPGVLPKSGIIPRPRLFERLRQAARVTLLSAPSGSGKTVLMRSWVGEADLADRAAWVPVRDEMRDPQRFWGSVLDALRDAPAWAAVVPDARTALDLAGWEIVNWLIEDLQSLPNPLWLVIDDLHKLPAAEMARQLGLLVTRAPPQLRLVLSTRRDPRLGLHRLRLDGTVTEIRAADLRFTAGEAKALFEAARIQLPDLALLEWHARTEGWAVGLRLAALSLARHPDPLRFAEEFCGSERTVAEYLLAEVLDQQPEPVRRMLLRTSVLDRVSGELADTLAGGQGSGQILQDLEEASAFVLSLDAQRSWFRYHSLFGDLLRLELRRTAAEELPALHAAAADWHARHGYPVEAVRHAQAARNWRLAARLLADHWPGLVLAGQSATVQELLTGFPAGLSEADPELVGITAVCDLFRGQLEQAERHLTRAAERLAAVSEERRERFQVTLAVARLWLAHGRGDLAAAVDQAERLLALGGAQDARQPGLSEELCRLARAGLAHALLRQGEADRVAAVLAEISDEEREGARMRTVLAALRLAQGDPRAATAALAPVLDPPAPAGSRPSWLIFAFLLEASARDALGDAGAVASAIERALDLAAPDSLLLPFLVHHAPELLDRHSRNRTSHSTMISSILSLLDPAGQEGLLDAERPTGISGTGIPPASTGPAANAGKSSAQVHPEPRAPREKAAARAQRDSQGSSPGLPDPLTESETRVLRYLPSHLTVSEIACQLNLSAHTVTTHMRHMYAKLGVHRRHEAVDRARNLGLLA